jgi:hypothetical protein
MNGRATLKFLAGIAVTAIALHVAISLAVVVAIPTLYPHRIFNVRAWSDDGNERYHLVGVFLREQARQRRPLVTFIGSSVTYGYPWDEEFVFSRIVADRSSGHVVNASIVAADITSINDWVVCGALRNAIEMDAAIIEVPVVNTTSRFLRLARERNAEPLVTQCRPAEPPDPDYMRLALTRPRGIGWLRFLSRSDAKERAESAIQIVPVPDDYFASATEFEVIREDYTAAVKTLLSNARRVARRVYVFPSPVFVGGLREIERDAEAIRAQLHATEEACRAVDGVDCVDTSALWNERHYYYNLTHLNQAGHRATADILQAAIDDIVRADARSAR